MIIFEWTILLLVSAVILSGIARRIGVPYPAFLALAGVVIAFLPAAPLINLDPDLVLALFVAPVLLDTAYDTSLRDLKRNWFAVGSLAVFAVIITTIAVAAVAHTLVPSMGWPAAIALGAIVAPPDAAAATAVLRQVALPRRILVILEGESLLNDATALLIYRAAVAAVGVGAFTPARVVPQFALVVTGSLVAGWVLARLFMLGTRRVKQVPSAIVLQFVGTFGVWLLADRIGLSGVLTVVVYGIVIARRAPAKVPARLRVPSYAVWETVVFVLNVMAFLMIGLQLRPIWERLSPGQRTGYVGIALAVVVTTILVRFVWVIVYVLVARLKILLLRHRKSRPTIVPTLRGAIVVSWCGMRGIVTLAAALALPERAGKGPFPYRDLILLCAFSVVFATLVAQGFTLRPLLTRFKLKDDGGADKDLSLARTRALQAALDVLKTDSSAAAEALRLEYEDALRQAADGPDGRAPERLSGDQSRRRAVDASRAAIFQARARGEIGDEAFHRVEEDLDWLEMSAGGQAGD